MNNRLCPWDILEPSTINFCEEKLCSWVVKPAETWSNISFILVGLLVIYLSRKENHPHLTTIGFVGITLGIFSGFFHASGTQIGAWLDISAMHLFTGIGIAFNLKRFNGSRILLTFAIVFIPSTILIYIHEWFGIILFGFQFIAALALEYMIYKKTGIKAEYGSLKAALGVVALAWGIWWMDLTKLWCDPSNHVLNGHAVWHLMVGTTFYFIYRFYTQFKDIDN